MKSSGSLLRSRAEPKLHHITTGSTVSVVPEVIRSLVPGALG
jgi:hypothetical protein